VNLDRKHLTRRVPILHEQTGLVIGFYTEHRDGRQDAQIVMPRLHIARKVRELR